MPFSRADHYRHYLRPLGMLSGAAAADGVGRGHALWLAGGPLAFALVEVLARSDAMPADVERTVLPVAGLLSLFERDFEAAEVMRPVLDQITAARPPWAGLTMDRPRVMGVVNVTPDSFSDGGRFLEAEDAIAQARALEAGGADILDIGGESTRPGSLPVSSDQEVARVLPVLQALSNGAAVRSIDSRRAETVGAALEAGAEIVNDVTALEADPDSMALVSGSGAAIVLMHMQGVPQSMQDNPTYANAPLDIYDYLADRIAACEAAGIGRWRIAVDPGIGFGKALTDNVELFDHLALFHGLGCPILLGASRKSFIARLSRGEPVEERLAGSLASAQAGLAQGVQILRVHDVAETVQAMAIVQAIAGWPSRGDAGDDAGAHSGLQGASRGRA